MIFICSQLCFFGCEALRTKNYNGLTAQWLHSTVERHRQVGALLARHRCWSFYDLAASLPGVVLP